MVVQRRNPTFRRELVSMSWVSSGSSSTRQEPQSLNAPSAPAGLARAARNGTSLDRDVGSDMETRRDHDRNELS